MELYHIYLQLPSNIRIVIDISLLVLLAIWFFLHFSFIGTNRRLTNLLESNRQVVDNTHRVALTLKKLSLELNASGPEDEAFYEELEPEDQTEPKDQNPKSIITCRKCYQLNSIGTQTCIQCNARL
jgi:hypothetical protein